MAESCGLSTETFVRQAGRGDASAVPRLLTRHRPRLRRMIAIRIDPRLSARVDPSDVVQDALAVAARRLPEYIRQPARPFYPWLRQIAWERLVDLHRRHPRTEKRAVTRERPPGILPDPSVMQSAERLAGSETSPSGHLVRAELGQSGAQPVARGHFAAPPAPIGSRFTAEIVVEPLSSQERSWVNIINSIIRSQNTANALASLSQPDRMVGNALTVRVVTNPPSPGDFDRDGDVDLADFLRIVECLAGPAEPVAPNCNVADLDWDGDVDLADVIAFERELTGSL